MVDYYGRWRADAFACRRCDWHGIGAELDEGELFEAVLEYDCPKCHLRVVTVSLPTHDEAIAHGSEADKAGALAQRAFHQALAAQPPLDPADLPDVPGGQFIATWDLEDRDERSFAIVRAGRRHLCRRMTWWEHADQFVATAHILKRRYGQQLRDFAPSPGSELYLYGDDLRSVERVRACREALFPKKR